MTTRIFNDTISRYYPGVGASGLRSLAENIGYGDKTLEADQEMLEWLRDLIPNHADSSPEQIKRYLYALGLDDRWWNNQMRVGFRVVNAVLGRYASPGVAVPSILIRTGLLNPDPTTHLNYAERKYREALAKQSYNTEP